MAKYLYYICACCFLFLFSRCGKGKSESEEIPFNPYVEAFTSGTISRYTPVYLIFNQEIVADRMKPEQLHDLVRIKPETAGEWAFENNRTIVFKPTKSFERNTPLRGKGRPFRVVRYGMERQVFYIQILDTTSVAAGQPAIRRYQPEE